MLAETAKPSVMTETTKPSVTAEIAINNEFRPMLFCPARLAVDSYSSCAGCLSAPGTPR